MNRRHLMAGAGLVLPALASASAWAQGRGREYETQYSTEVRAAATASLETSRVAAERTRHESIKRFAEFEIAEQQTLLEVVGMLGEAQDSVAPPAQPKTDQKMAVQRLREAEEGDFDRAYLDLQTQGHQQLLAIQERYLQRGKDPASRAVAMLARGHIKEHLTQIDLLKRSLG